MDPQVNLMERNQVMEAAELEEGKEGGGNSGKAMPLHPCRHPQTSKPEPQNLLAEAFPTLEKI